jgi:hypothetical protein
MSAAVPATPISQSSEINKSVINIIERDTFRVALGYTLFALSTLTVWKVIAAAIIISNVNGFIAAIISKIKNNNDSKAFMNDLYFFHGSLNFISMIAIGYIHSSALINFVKYGIK